MVAYLDSDNSERIVFAIGIKEGTGPDCYRLADIGGVIDVEDVDSSLPDSSDLVHGEVYVSKNDSGNWCFVNLGSDKKTREIKEIEEESYIFRSIKTGHKWFFNKKTQSCKRDDEFYSAEQIRDISGLRVYVQPDEPEDKKGVIWIDTSSEDQRDLNDGNVVNPYFTDLINEIKLLKDTVQKHEFAFNTVISSGGFTNNVRNFLSSGTSFIKGFITEDKDTANSTTYYYDKDSKDNKFFTVLITDDGSKNFLPANIKVGDIFYNPDVKKIYNYNENKAISSTDPVLRHIYISQLDYCSYEWDGEKMVQLVDYSDDEDTKKLIKEGKNLDTSENQGGAEIDGNILDNPDWYLWVKFSNSQDGTDPVILPDKSWETKDGLPTYYIGLSRSDEDSNPSQDKAQYYWTAVGDGTFGYTCNKNDSGYIWVKFADKDKNKIYNYYVQGVTDLIGFSFGRSGKLESTKESDYSWYNISEKIGCYPVSQSTYPEWAETGAKYELPNAKHICIKMGTFKKMRENIDSLLQGELCWCYDVKRLYIISRDDNNSQVAVWLNNSSATGGGSSSSGGGIDMNALSEALNTLSTLGFTAQYTYDYTDDGKNQSVQTYTADYKVKVDTSGNWIVYKKSLDSTISAPTQSNYNKKPFLDKKLFINSVYCGGLDSDEHSYNYCSHNFVELSNVSDSNINLNGLSIQYSNSTDSTDKTWIVLPLWGEIKAHSTFLIRGAQCSVMNTNTTKIKVPEYDMEWYTDKQNSSGSMKLVHFDDQNAKFYLCYGNTPGSGRSNPYQVNTSGLDLPYGFIDLVGFHNPKAKEKITAFIGDSYNYLSSSRLLIRYYPLDMTSQALKDFTKRNNSTEWYYVDLTKEDGEIIPSIEKFKPEASKEGKTIYFNKSVYSDKKPNLVTCTFGIQATVRDVDYSENSDHTYKTTSRTTPILASRCFNWISKDYYPEYVWWKKIKDIDGNEILDSWHEQESFNEGSYSYIASETSTQTITLEKVTGTAAKTIISEADLNKFISSSKEGDYFTLSLASNSDHLTTGMNGTYFVKSIADSGKTSTSEKSDCTITGFTVTDTSTISSVTSGASDLRISRSEKVVRIPRTIKTEFPQGYQYYERIRSESTDGNPFVTHKVVLHEIFDSGTYVYKIGRKTKSGEQNPDYMSDTYSFTVYPDSKLFGGFKIAQTTDQQGFNWDEYQIWRDTAGYINTDSKSRDIKFTINTGDMTQNGNRINEWIDYIDARNEEIPGKEDMVTIGNNDLCPPNPYHLGTGEDDQKVNHINISFYYTFELNENYWDPETKKIETSESDSNISLFPLFKLPLVDGSDYKDQYVPSLYSFNYGFVHFICINSEIKDSTENYVWGTKAGEVYYKIEQWLEADIQWSQSEGYIWNFPYMHEVPFTIVTYSTIHSPNSGYLNATGTAISNIHVDRGGSHLNNQTTHGKFWITKLFEKYGIKIATGGHKHTYSVTWPLLEGYDGKNDNTSFTPIIQVTKDDLINAYSTSDIYVSNDTLGVSTDEERKALKTSKTDEEFENLFFMTDSVTGRKYPKSTTYRTTDRKSLVKKFTCGYQLVNEATDVKAVVYYTLQATGYKNTSNKELPYKYIGWDRYFCPCTSSMADKPNPDPKGNKDKANSYQFYPFYCIWNFTTENIVANSRRMQGAESGNGKYNINDKLTYRTINTPFKDIGANNGSGEGKADDLIVISHYIQK